MQGNMEMALCLGQFVPQKRAQQPGTTMLPGPRSPSRNNMLQTHRAPKCPLGHQGKEPQPPHREAQPQHFWLPRRPGSGGLCSRAVLPTARLSVPS